MQKISILTLSLIGIMSAAGFTSCGVDDPKSEMTLSEAVNNIVIPSDSEGEVSVQKDCKYSFVFDFVNNEVAISTADLQLGGSKASFTTEPFDFKLLYYGNKRIYTFNGGEGTLAGGGTQAGKEVKDFKGVFSEEFFLFVYDYGFYPASSRMYMPLLSYKAGDYTVKTFASDSYFAGTTTTTYPGKDGMQSFNSDDAIYRIIFSEDLKTADVVIYDIKFAQEMPNPLKMVVLENVEVKYSANGYSISGENIMPKYLEGDGLTDYPERVFDSFHFETVAGDMANGKCEYVCAKVFKGEFYGRCIPSLD